MSYTSIEKIEEIKERKVLFIDMETTAMPKCAKLLQIVTNCAILA